MFTKCNGFIVSGDPLVYADSATMTGQGTVSEPFGVKSTDLFVQEPLYTGTSGNSAYIGWNNETVLYDVPAGSTAVTLSELATNFERLKITYNSHEATTAVPEIREVPSTATTFNLFQRFVKSSDDFVIDDVQRYNTNDFINYTTTTAAGSHAWYSMPFTYAGASQGSVVSITKVVGINRKQ